MNEPPPTRGEARQRLDRAMRLVAQGDRSALRVVYQATHAKLFGIALRILGDRKEAEETIQDVYVTLWQKAGRFDPARASPISWLAVIARNRAVDALRRRGGPAFASLDAAAAIADATPLADEQLVDAERDARIHQCLGGLDGEQGSAIRGAFLQGQTYASLAERQGVPLGTMKSRIRRGLARLKACMERAE